MPLYFPPASGGTSTAVSVPTPTAPYGAASAYFGYPPGVIPYVGTSATGSSTTNNLACFGYPVVLSRTASFEAIQTYIATPDSAANSFRVALFKQSTTDSTSWSLAGQTVSFATNLTGAKTHVFPTPLVLPRGVYILARITNSTAGFGLSAYRYVWESPAQTMTFGSQVVNMAANLSINAFDTTWSVNGFPTTVTTTVGAPVAFSGVATTLPFNIYLTRYSYLD